MRSAAPATRLGEFGARAGFETSFPIAVGQTAPPPQLFVRHDVGVRLTRVVQRHELAPEEGRVLLDDVQTRENDGIDLIEFAHHRPGIRRTGRRNEDHRRAASEIHQARTGDHSTTETRGLLQRLVLGLSPHERSVGEQEGAHALESTFAQPIAKPFCPRSPLAVSLSP